MMISLSQWKTAKLLSCFFTATVGFSVPPVPSTAWKGSDTVLLATWSNGQAVQDYQNFLSSGKQELFQSDDQASVIIKSGESKLADALVTMGNGDDLVLSPGQDLPESLNNLAEYPIYITLPATELEDFLANLPESYKARPEDFVFFSGGMEYGNIEDILKEKGYCRDQMTQVLISGLEIKTANRFEDLKVSLGVDSYGEEKLAGECAACGKWAGSIATRLERYEVFCRKDFYREWRRRMWERSVYDAVLNLIGAIRDEQPTTLADVAKYYTEELEDMVWEMSQLLRGWRAITLMYGFEQRLLEYAENRGAEEQCKLESSMYPFIWGNQVFLQSKTFCEYLNYAQSEKGLLEGIEVPQKSDDDFQSQMRQGNLRADGVI